MPFVEWIYCRMVVTSYTEEFPCPIAPARMFRALIVEASDLIPRLLPQFIRSVELVQGNGGAGSIEQVNFTEGTSTIDLRNGQPQRHQLCSIIFEHGS